MTMRARGTVVLSATVMLSFLGCAAPAQQVTYDRYDKQSATYINDTAKFAMVFGRDWRVSTDVEPTQRIFQVLPVISGTEVTLKAAAEGIGLWMETTHVANTLQLEQLQPIIYRNDESYFRQHRYKVVSLDKKDAHGIEYIEWVYNLRTPDRDDTMVEALFVRAGYAVRIRAKSSTEQFDAVKGRIDRLLGSLTAVEDMAGKLTQ